jgi:hypothetical protein
MTGILYDVCNVKFVVIENLIQKKIDISVSVVDIFRNFTAYEL